MKWIIDRIENDFAICEFEKGKTVSIPKTALPNGVCEGDVISVCADINETKKRKEEIEGLVNSLFKD